MYIAGPEDIVEASSKVIIREGLLPDRDQQGTRDGRTKLPTTGLGSLQTVLQTWTELYGHPHGICRFIGLYGRRMQLFLVLATYCVVLGPIPSAKHLIERTLTHLSP